MSVEINRALTSAEIQDLLVNIFSPYLKGISGTTIHPYFSTDNYTRAPFAYARANGHELAKADGYPRADYNFVGQLRPEQMKTIDKSFRLLSDANCLLLATHVGFGKTIMAIYILSQLKLKTFILCNRKVLLLQWKEALETFLENPRVCLLSAKERIDYDSYDIFVLNALNVPKLSDSLHNVGLLIVDEIHLVLSPKTCQSLLYFTPRYLVGLSATPYRTDDSNKLFTLFFGDTVIFKPLISPHTVYKVLTGFEPELITNAQGRLDWDKILTQQAENKMRNELIVSLVQEYPYKFIILCKRVAQIQVLEDLFIRAGIAVCAVFGAESIDRSVLADKKVIVGTFQKLGVGFDDKSATALLLAADVEEYFIQYLGRVFRNPQVQPIIFDLVDRARILDAHYIKRERIYREVGATRILILNKSRTLLN